MKTFLIAALSALISFPASAQVLSLSCDVVTHESFSSGTRTTKNDTLMVTIETIDDAIYIEGVGGSIHFGISNQKIANVFKLVDRSTTSRWEIETDFRLPGLPQN